MVPLWVKFAQECLHRPFFLAVSVSGGAMGLSERFRKPFLSKKASRVPQEKSNSLVFTNPLHIELLTDFPTRVFVPKLALLSDLNTFRFDVMNPLLAEPLGPMLLATGACC